MVKEKGSELAHSDTVQSLKNKMGSSVNFVYEKFFPQSSPSEQEQNQELSDNTQSEESHTKTNEHINQIERKEK
jgi:hypothetical protein